MEFLRTFVAIDIKVEPLLRKKWGEIKSLLCNDSIKWVDEHTIHLTLFFLGDTPQDQVKEIAQSLELHLRDILSFRVTVNGLGFFGNKNQPKVIWAGVTESKPLFQLKENVNHALLNLGFDDPNEKFSPHLTLGRVKQIKSSDSLITYINRNKHEILQEVVIDKVIFYQSILKPTGPIYKPLKEIKLLSL